MNKIIKILLSLITLGFLLLIYFLARINITQLSNFDGNRAFEDIKYQLSLGPRTVNSEAHKRAVEWIITTLKSRYWDIEIQDADISGADVKNIIAKRGKGEPWIIIASHYDSRLYADKDPMIENRKQAVPGANDGASTVAILLELARILPSKLDKQVWLVFFDAEDNGRIPGYDWDLGSEYFVSQLKGKPDSVVILDMLGDKELDIYEEKNSDPELTKEIWDVASSLGYTQFIPAYKYAILDDHLPFIRAGIRAIDIIDFDYPYWHTINDTIDKVSANSLVVVGNTILKWLDFDSNKK